MTEIDGVIAYLLFVVLLMAALFVIIMIPAYIAFKRQHPNRWLILALCVFFGGTGVGWVVALIWALRVGHISSSAEGTHGGESGLNLFVNDVRSVMTRGADSHTTARPSVHQTSGVDDTLLRLERLEKLRAAGQIDQSEFERLKAVALSDI